MRCSRRSQKSIKPLILEVQGLFIVINIDTTKKLITVIVVIGSMQMVICNHFHERLANNGEITTFMGVPLFYALMCRFLCT